MAYSILVNWTALDLGRKQKQLITVDWGGFPFSHHLTQNLSTPMQQASTLLSPLNSQTPSPAFFSVQPCAHQL